MGQKTEVIYEINGDWWAGKAECQNCFWLGTLIMHKSVAWMYTFCPVCGMQRTLNPKEGKWQGRILAEVDWHDERSE